MKTRKFWRWKNQNENESEPRILELYGTIAEESWFDDEVTPQMFHQELFQAVGRLSSGSTHPEETALLPAVSMPCSWIMPITSQ